MKITQISSADPSIQAGTVTAGEERHESFSDYLNSSEKSLTQIFQNASETYGVPFSLLTAVGMQESSFRADAVSKAGAQGIMQLMPRTAAGLGVTDSFDPEQNIMGGAKYLRELLDKYDGNTSFALAAYNAGGNNVDKYGGIPPFAETQSYVEKVLSYMTNGVTLPDGTVTTHRPETSAGIYTPAGATSDFAEDLKSLLFSHDDYLKFLELFMELADLKNDKDAQEEQEAMQQQSSYRYAQTMRKLL